MRQRKYQYQKTRTTRTDVAIALFLFKSSFLIAKLFFWDIPAFIIKFLIHSFNQNKK